MESTFSGADFGDSKGYHLTTAMLQTVGKDVCRALLIYNKIYLPNELNNEVVSSHA